MGGPPKVCLASVKAPVPLRRRPSPADDKVLPQPSTRRPYRRDPVLSCLVHCCPTARCEGPGHVFSEDDNPKVMLHVYDLAESGLLRTANALLQPLGTGAFHVGVEVYGWEWSFGTAPRGQSGVFYCTPKSCGRRCYREAVVLGDTDLSPVEVDSVIRKLEGEWPGEHYDLLRRNCVHFCECLLKKLVKDSTVPSWISALCDAGAAMQDRVMRVGTWRSNSAGSSHSVYVTDKVVSL